MTWLLFILRIAFMAILYGFLASLTWIIWRELKQGSQASQTTSAAARGSRLTVVDAGDSGYSEGKQFPLGAVTTLGRDLSNDIVISDGYTSSRHARVERQGDGRFWVVDEGSSNGTLLNGRPLHPNDPTPLDPGDVIGIGKIELKMG